MINPLYFFCKGYCYKTRQLTDEDLIRAYDRKVKTHIRKKGAVRNGCYYRDLIIISDGKRKLVRIRIQRTAGNEAGHTGILMDSMIPECSYSAMFIATVMKDYLQRNEKNLTVSQICDRWEISVSTLYEWKKTYHDISALLSCYPFITNTFLRYPYLPTARLSRHTTAKSTDSSGQVIINLHPPHIRNTERSDGNDR